MEFIRTITDAFQSLTKNLNERVKSPIGGAFFFSWLLINWKLVYYITFQNDTPEAKIKHIEMFFTNYKDLIYIPSLLAVVYIIASPVISNLSTLIWTFLDRRFKSFTAKVIEGSVPISNKEQAILYDLMRNQTRSHEDEKSELESQIQALNALISNNTAGEKKGLLEEAPVKKSQEVVKKEPDKIHADNRPLKTIPLIHKVSFENDQMVGFDYKISPEIIKKLYKEGVSIQPVSSLKFAISEIDESIKNALIDLFYSITDQKIVMNFLMIPEIDNINDSYKLVNWFFDNDPGVLI